MDRQVEEAIKVFKNGGIVIFPTDTAIGIGCRIDNELAVERLFEIRKRPSNKAVPVLFNDMAMVRKYVEKTPRDADILMKKYWPGALTLILRCNKEKVPPLVRGGGETLGVRIPAGKIIQKIITRLGVPILGPSANFSGEKTPFKFNDMNPKLIALADYVLRENVTSKRDVSTVVNCAVRPWKIIRNGAVSVSC